MSESFSFAVTTRVVFGEGSRQQAGALARGLGAERALLVADPGVLGAGLHKEVAASLEKAGVPVSVFSDFHVNPRESEAASGAEAAREAGANLLVAVGGGSAMDCAKAVGVALTHEPPIKQWIGIAKLQRPITPLICVPTTAGTGSEVTRVTVLSDPERGSKRALIDFRVAPVIALCDPELTYGLPPTLTAGTGMDALTHAIESYTCRAATALSRPLSLAAASLVAKHLNRAYDHPDDREARSGMLLGATTAAIAFGNSDVGAVHSLSQAMGGLFDVPHGVANACLLPYVTAYNVSAGPDAHVEVARALGIIAAAEAAPKSLVRWLGDLNTQLRIPALKEFGFGEDALPRIAQAAVDNVTTESNLRDVDVASHLRILQAAWAQRPATELLETA